MKTRAFFYMLFFSIWLYACNSEGRSHRYLNDKRNPSEKIAEGQKKASRKAEKDFKKGQKNGKAQGSKKIKLWQKKKAQYT
ncbi:MAG: hypothetical protein HY064_03675 [Bacteroidetes bacterium]|nr:hypothetical protein [Bacteroidota bacterium]